MKGIIFTSLENAEIALNQCNSLAGGQIEYKGIPPFIEPETKPFARIIKHPTLNKWALCADDYLCEYLNLTCVELSSDWLNINNNL